MNDFGRHAFLISLLLHAGAILVLLLVSAFSLILKNKEEFTFEMVNLPSNPAPMVTPPPVKKEEPADLPPETTETLPEPEAESEPEPEPEPEKMSFEEFIALHGKPKPQTPRKRPVPPPARNVAGEVSQLLDDVRFETPVISTDQAVLDAWRSSVKARIDQNWRKPSLVADGGIQVVLEFTVQGDGTVRQAIVARSSGFAAMDQSALEALQQAGRLPPPPDGKTLRTRITLSLE